MNINLTVDELKKLMASAKEPEAPKMEEIEFWTPLLDEDGEIVDGYEISSLGRLIKDGELKKSWPIQGYLICGINGEKKQLHRLVLQSFRPTDDKTLLADHIDNNGLNPRLSNLQWLTNSENTAKGYRQNAKKRK